MIIPYSAIWFVEHIMIPHSLCQSLESAHKRYAKWEKAIFVVIVNKYVFSSAGVPAEVKGSYLHEQTLCHKEGEVELCLAQNCFSEFTQQRLHTGHQCFFIHPKSA